MADPRLNLTINDEQVTLFMSFGLLDRLVTVVGQTQQSVSFEMDEVTRGLVLREVLLKRGKSGIYEGEIDQFSLDDYLMEVEDGIRILDWVTEHVMDFFVRTVERAKATTEKMTPRIKSLQDSASGSKD